MKALKFFSTMLILLAMCMPMTSCGGDEPEPVIDNTTTTETANSLKGTSWSYTDRYEYDGWTATITQRFTFNASTATYTVETREQEGNQVTTDYTTSNYTYTYEDGLVVLIPQDAGKAYLEGKISSNIKMDVYNVDRDYMHIGTFYKE